MSGVTLLQAVLLFSTFSPSSSTAPEDEHDFCANRFNQQFPPVDQGEDRDILLDTYNYYTLFSPLMRPDEGTFQPIFSRYDADGISPEWSQQVSTIPCRVSVTECKFGGMNADTSQDNWFVTQFIRLTVDNKDPTLMVNFTLTYCDQSLVCSNNFRVYIIPANEEELTIENIETRIRSIKSSGTRSDFQYTGDDNTVTTTFGAIGQNKINNKEGLYVAFRSQDACVTIHRIQVFYWKCPMRMLIDLVDFTKSHYQGDTVSLSTVQCLGNSTYRLGGVAKGIATCSLQSSPMEAYWRFTSLEGGGVITHEEVCGCDPGYGYNVSTEQYYGTSAAIASDCVSWISAFGVTISLLIISWSIFIATCVVAVCMYKKVHISRKNEKYTSQKVTNEGAIKGGMERNPAYIPIEMSQIEDKPTYVNL